MATSTWNRAAKTRNAPFFFSPTLPSRLIWTAVPPNESGILPSPCEQRKIVPHGLLAEYRFGLPLKTIVSWVVPCDLCAANQSSTARPLLPPRIVALVAFPVHGGKARRLARRRRTADMWRE